MMSRSTRTTFHILILLATFEFLSIFKCNASTPSCSSGNASQCESSHLDEEISRIAWPPSQPSFLSSVQSFFAGDDDDDGSDLSSSIHEEAASLRSALIATRRVLHRHPELMYRERLTGQIVQRILRGMGIPNEDISLGWGKNIHSPHYNSHSESEGYDGGGFGIVVDVGSGEKPCVLLRADMDALPLAEETPLPPDLIDDGGARFRSEHLGTMHACGHDGHMAMLLGAARLLHRLSLRSALPGTVRIIFQPAEEGGAGAKRMAEEGVLAMRPSPSCAFAMHVWPTLPSGRIGFRSGPMLAAADMFTLVVEGVGGHAAFPHLVSDPIVAASSIVMNVQTLVSRGMNPLESGVVSVSQFEAGDGAFNVIPSKAVLRGTIRALSDDALIKLREGLVRIARSTAEAHGCKLADETFSKDHYPVTINDDGLYPFAKRVAGMVAEGGEVTEVDPTMGAEDFGFLAQGVPSAFFFLGQGGNDVGKDDAGDGGESCVAGCESGARVPTNLGLHHPEFNLDEEVLPRGVELFVNLALRALHELKNRD